MGAKHGKWIGALVAVLMLISIAFLSCADTSNVSKDNVATVNGTAITRAELDREMGRARQQLTSTGRSLGSDQISKMEKSILEDLIKTELLYQESQAQKIEIDDATIDEYLATVKKRFPVEAQFEESLKEMNISQAELRSSLRQSKAIDQLIDKQIIQKINISEEESKSYYDGNPEFFKQPGQVRASHILIKVDPGADESQKASARKELEKVQKKLKKGEDFAALAKEFSQGPSGPSGGDLGYFGPKQMVKPFEDAAFALKSGEVSDIVETRFGYHLIKVVDKKAESTMPYEEIKDKLAQYLKQQKIRKEVDSYIETLTAKAKVEVFLTESP
jgi:peptidyl-prolyl cis-trans isomerase C